MMWESIGVVPQSQKNPGVEDTGVSRCERGPLWDQVMTVGSFMPV